MKRQIHPFYLSSAPPFYKTLIIDLTLHTTEIVKRGGKEKPALHPVDHSRIIFSSDKNRRDREKQSKNTDIPDYNLREP